MIDAEKLLAPIAPDAPAGRDLRAAAEDRTHRTVKELRTGGEDGDAASANWSAIRRQCEEALANSSKDLEIAGWLAEALARTEGLGGLLEGLALIRALATRYWDDVHPQGLHEGGKTDFSARIARLNWLATDRVGLLPSVRAIGIVGNSDQRGEWLGWQARLESERVARAAATNQASYEEMLAAKQTTPEQWSGALGVTPLERIREHAAAARACEREARAIEALTGERVPDDSANLQGLTSLLVDIAEFLEARLPSERTGDDGRTQGGTGAGASGTARASSGAVGSRADALARLSDVARYFRDTEPHSPVSRLIERAVRWGNMTFEDLLRDVVKSDDALKEIWETLGVKPPDSGASS